MQTPRRFIKSSDLFFTRLLAFLFFILPRPLALSHRTRGPSRFRPYPSLVLAETPGTGYKNRVSATAARCNLQITMSPDVGDVAAQRA